MTVPSVVVFGLTVFATRLPVAIVGSLSIIILYFLTLEIFDNKHIERYRQQSNNLIFYLFYDKIDPRYFQSIGSPRDADGLRFKNIIFSQVQCPTRTPRDLFLMKNPKTIFVNKFDCVTDKNFTTVGKIKRPDGSIAFMLEKQVQ